MGEALPRLGQLGAGPRVGPESSMGMRQDLLRPPKGARGPESQKGVAELCLALATRSCVYSRFLIAARTAMLGGQFHPGTV